MVEKAFTPQPGFCPWVQLENLDNVERFTLPSDNYYINMLNYFVDTVRTETDWHSHLDAILSQAKLLDEIRIRSFR